MRLIEALAAGMVGAENGTAEIYERGNTQRASWYQDFEATSVVDTGADIALDSNGRAEVYVAEVVDVVVKDTSGATVATFTSGGYDGTVEVRSPAFTGIDYQTSQSAASNPVSLETIIDLWKTNSGAIDWKVLFNGSATTLQVALSALTGLLFNVKDPTYGAKGDGATDDTAAIQAALTAAAVSGGTVYFPPGVYRTTATLTFDYNVNLVGASPRLSKIGLDDASANIMQRNGTVATFFDAAQFIGNLHLYHMQTGVGNCVLPSVQARMVFFNCVFGDSTKSNAMMFYAGTDTDVRFDNCQFFCGGEFSRAIVFHGAATGSRLVATGCIFESPNGGAYNPLNGMVHAARETTISNCQFRVWNHASGTAYGIYVGAVSGNNIAVTGCQWLTNASKDGYLFKFAALSGVQNFIESGNTTEEDSTTRGLYDAYTPDTSGYPAQLNSRETRSFRASVGGASVSTLNAYGQKVGVMNISITDNAAGAPNPAVAPPGATLTMSFVESSGAGTGTMTWGANMVTTAATFTVNTGKVSVFKFVSYSSAVAWLEVSKSENM